MRRQSQLASLIATAALCFAFACTDDPASPTDAGHDGGRDGGDDMIDSGGDSGATNPACVIPPQTDYLRSRRTVGVCPEVDAPPCSYTPFGGAPLLAADQLAPGAKFIAASRKYVLAEAPRPDGSWEPIVVELFGAEWRTLDFAVAPDMRARDIDGRILLLCGHADCQLFTIALGGVIEELPGARIAAEPAPAGVLDWRGQGMACVFGDGVRCFDGADWLEVVPASGPRFNAAVATVVSIWAVGDEGRIVAATPECSIELPSGTDAALRSVSADRSRDLWATVAGDDGVLAYVTLDETITCHAGSASWAEVHRTWGQAWGYGVAHIYDYQWLLRADGLLIQGRPSNGGDWCTYSIGAEVLEATTAACGIAENHIVVTPTTVLGVGDCYID